MENSKLSMIKAYMVKNFQPLVKHIPFFYKKYWDNQYSKYGFSPKYSGSDGNSSVYDKIFQRLDVLFKELNIKKDCSVLDIGCGAGIYTDYFVKRGFRGYTGIDFNENIVKHLSKKYPQYNFYHKDITKSKISGEYKLIIMFSLTQHIIRDKDFEFLMHNINHILDEGGHLFVTDCLNINKRASYHIRWRPLDYYKKVLDMDYLKNIKFRSDDSPKRLFVFRKWTIK